MAFKTINFLPEVFRSTANRKFLSATVDQLTSQPDFKKINGYVGRRLAPTFKVGDNYLTEPTANRQNYQLEPGLVLNDANNGSVNMFTSYVDLLDKITFYGGNVTNHSRLFSSDYYSYSGLVDLDKLVNFGQYYWLISGPPVVGVFTGLASTQEVFDIALDNKQFVVAGIDNTPNPDLVVARGGVYTFNAEVSMDGTFWIQTNANPNGTLFSTSNVSSRQVYGVSNNGIPAGGGIVFSVPRVDDQSFYSSMETTAVVDYATSIPFTEIHDRLLSKFTDKWVGLDGVSTVLDGKYLVFLNENNLYNIDEAWLPQDVFSGETFDFPEGFSDAGPTIPFEDRSSIWRISLIPTNGNADYLIKLSKFDTIDVNFKVFISNGYSNAGKEFFKDTVGFLEELPPITAPLDVLYYVNSTSTGVTSGRIIVVDSTTSVIDVTRDILGKTTYTSPNRVTFTNGLKVRFNSQVTPIEYANETFYVEQVGKGIRLVNEKDLFTPEATSQLGTVRFDIYGFSEDKFDESINILKDPDFVTINRSSVDLNSWSRGNRWVHRDVIEYAYSLNNTVPVFDQTLRSVRPIIEFNPDTLLYNYGRVFRDTVDLIDFTVTDAFNQLNGLRMLDLTFPPSPDYLPLPPSIALTDGYRFIFAADVDPTVRNKIYTISIVSIDSYDIVYLIPDTSGINQYDVIIQTNGEVQPAGDGGKGTNYWLDIDAVTGEPVWKIGQKKVIASQFPLFDILDSNFNSYSDTTFYPSSTFVGSRLFGYSDSTALKPTVDTILKFPIKYKNFNSIGDISFTNFYDVDTFEYTDSSTGVPVVVKQNVSLGNSVKIIDISNIVIQNAWQHIQHPSTQHQIFTYEYVGSTKFQFDIVPVDLHRSNFRVLVNSTLLSESSYTVDMSEPSLMFVNITFPWTDHDKVDILINSNQVSKYGFYEVPENLNLNSMNSIFTDLTLGQIRNHLDTTAVNLNGVIGLIPGPSNLRDLEYSSASGNILQHQAPVIYSQLFLLDPTLNFINGIDNAQKEYSKFKYKFLDASLNLNMESISSIKDAVDSILASLNLVKNSSFPWYYSDMVPYGSQTNIINYTVLNSEITDYEITSSFNVTELSNQAVLVYYNNEQLVINKDYIFRPGYPVVRLLFVPAVDDTIQIVEYKSTDGCYIPETPTKLGLHPKYVPELRFDNTYSTPTNVVVGHDGSLTIAFNDYRDDLLLELEKRIFNNLKTTYDSKLFDIFKVIPGKFRTTDYSKEEFDKILSRSFLKWIGSNKLNFSANVNFAGNDPWSWNYSKNVDKISSEPLQGFWRGIYKYFYDTDTPHLTPWEMLGISIKPDWWEDRYGPAPYSGGNLVLWRDMESGFVAGGPNTGYLPDFARPGLVRVIPVDDHGNLKSPYEFILGGYNGNNFAENFVFGDCGPAESAWRRSSDYPFALQAALALAKPANYFGTCLNINTFTYNSQLSQILNNEGKFISPTNIKINSEIVDGVVTRNTGYLNWIVDALTTVGIDGPTKIRSYLNQIDVCLGYKVAGFTDQNYINVYAEQSSPSSVNDSVVIPDSNYRVYLHKSPPVTKTTYSAVIIEKTSNGFAVKGYDTSNPYFTVIPSNTTSDSYALNVLGLRAVIYSSGLSEIVNIPYGFELTSTQQVVDFLISYQRYLVYTGFVFDTWNADLSSLQDWVLSVKEFLTWAQQGWSERNIIVLSPGFNQIHFNSGNYFIDQISNDFNGSRILDQNFVAIKPTSFEIIRNGSSFTLTTDDKVVAFVELHLVQYEHTIVFDNETMFKDVIYKPESGNRQFRLKIVGSKTSNWTGKLDPGGFIYNSTDVPQWQSGKDYLKGDLVVYKSKYYTALEKISAVDNFDFNKWQLINKKNIKTGLLQNFSLNAQKFEEFYNVDTIGLDESMDLFAKGIIGFRPRQYLTDLGIDTATQIKFYQGFIRDKGTQNAISAMQSATFSNLTNEIDVYEEWGLRAGEYGGVENSQFFEIILDKGVYSTDPVSFELLNDSDVTQDAVIGVKVTDLYKRPETFTKDFVKNRTRESLIENDISTAGYVNIDDIDITIFDLTNYVELNNSLTKIGSGFKIWVAKDFKRDWNVFRINETENQALSIKYIDDFTAEITTEFPHQLTVNEVFAFKGLSNSVDSFYRVTTIDTIYKVIVKFLKDVAPLRTVSEIVGRAILYKLVSLRYNYLSEVGDTVLLHNWKTIDKVWIDQSTQNAEWGVYKKNEPFNKTADFVPRAHSVDDKYGFCVRADKSGNSFYLVSEPTESGQGSVDVYTGDVTSTTNIQHLTPTDVNTVRFGHSVDISSSYAIVGAPDGPTVAKDGQVYVYQRDVDDVLTLTQIIEAPEAAGQFGYAISVSNDNNWLYVGAPAINKVYSYKLVLGSYVFNSTFTESLDASAMYGASVKTTATGQQVIIGAPKTTETVLAVPYLKAGAAYLYSRIVTNIIPNGIDVAFESPNTNIFSVSLNGILKELDVDYTVGSTTVTFVIAPKQNEKITIETGNSNFVQKLIQPTVGYNANFGQEVEMSDSGSNIFVSAPYYNENTYHSGVVDCFANQGLEYGEIVGLVQPSAISINDSLFINNFEVVATGITLAAYIDDINNAGVPGVVASSSNNYLKLVVSSVETSINVTPGVGTLFDDLGLIPLVETQQIRHPEQDLSSNQQFGIKVRYDNLTRSIVISSQLASLTVKSDFDLGETLFDNRMTEFYDSVRYSGAIYVYELLVDSRQSILHPHRFGFIQQLRDTEIKSFDQFGQSIDFVNNQIIAGSPSNDDSGTDVGKVYFFNNPDNLRGWEKFRAQDSQVDVSCINRIFLYQKSTNEIITSLDFIDPVKGKLLGVADENIDFKTSADPARYNAGNSATLSIDESYQWSTSQVGKIWWDLNEVRFMNYEQGTVVYRSTNWAKMFPGSTVSVYEWIESDVVPSEYIALGRPGTPKYIHNEAYATSVYIDKTTNTSKNLYYFWVTGLATIASNKTASVINISNYLLSPRDSGIAYAGFPKSNAVVLYGVNKLLSGSDVVIHIEYSSFVNREKIPYHSEFEFLQEGNNNFVFPSWFVNKTFDSLVGFNLLGDTVPDMSIIESQRYGIHLKPRQTMFKDRLTASKVAVDFINKKCLLFPISAQSDLTGLYTIDPVPSESEYDLRVENNVDLSYVDLSQWVDGTRVLIVTDSRYNNHWTVSTLADHANLTLVLQQQYNTTDCWNFIDWYAPTFNNTSQYTYTVETEKDVLRLETKKDDTIFVKNSNKGGFIAYKVDASLNKVIVGLENGTIQISTKLYTSSESTLFNQYRSILETVRNDIFIKTLSGSMNEMMFALLYYAMSEQKDIDWLFKTSFISILHRLRKLEQYPAYIRDNQDYYLQYIDEIKPYRTKIREYLIDYYQTDYVKSSSTDFDLPPYYEASNKTYRSPSGELSGDQSLLTNNSNYAEWNNNYAYTVESIVLLDAGTGFETAPTVTVTGGGGSGCICTAVLNYFNGSIISIVVNDSGKGYTSTPTVTINGAGGHATAYAMLSNKKVRTTSTTIKFDRNSYDSSLTKWVLNGRLLDKYKLVAYSTGFFLVGEGKYNMFAQSTRFNVTGSPQPVGNIFVRSGRRALRTQPPIIAIKLTGTSVVLTPSVRRLVITTVSTAFNILGTDVKYPIYTTGTRLFYNNAAYTALNNINDATVFEITKYTKIASETLNAADRIMAYYNPAIGSPEKNLSKLMTGITYTGVEVLGLNFSEGSDTGEDTRLTDYRLNYIGAASGQYEIVTTSGHYTVSLTENDLKERYKIRTKSGKFVTSSASSALIYINERRMFSVSYGAFSTSGTDTVLKIQNRDILAPGTIISQESSGASAAVISHHSSEGYLIVRSVLGILMSGTSNQVTDGAAILGTLLLDVVPLTPKVDSIIETSFTDSETPLADEIIINGGGFIDIDHSHAPEELYPGQTFDTLAMSVYTKMPSGDFIGYRIEQNLNGLQSFKRIAAENSTTLDVDLLQTDSVMYVVDASKLAVPDADNAVPGEIYVNGERIRYYSIDLNTNSISQIRRHVGGTGSPMTHLAGSRVIDSSARQTIPNAMSTVANRTLIAFIDVPFVLTGTNAELNHA